jgi:hypothetical protein
VLVLPEDDVAVKVVIADPPVAPAVNGTETTPEDPPEAVPIVGAAGIVVAVTEALAEDAVELPLAFLAVMAYVYPVADCNPVTVNGDEPPVAVNDPGVLVTV